MQNKETVTFTVTVDEANLILRVLQEQPYHMVALLIQKLVSQPSEMAKANGAGRPEDSAPLATPG